MQPFHFFDPYRADKDRAAAERAAWRKTLPHKGSRRKACCGAALLRDESRGLSLWRR
jgi:hypothetical protein